MTKAEAKEAFFAMFPQWRDERGLTPAQLEHPSFTDFKLWTREKHYSHYFNFRSVGGAEAAVEAWFNQYFKQTWRD